MSEVKSVRRGRPRKTESEEKVEEAGVGGKYKVTANIISYSTDAKDVGVLVDMVIKQGEKEDRLSGWVIIPKIFFTEEEVLNALRKWAENYVEGKIATAENISKTFEFEV